MAEDDDRAREWDRAAEDDKTVADDDRSPFVEAIEEAAAALPDVDGVPVAVEPPTPRPETTGRHRLTPAAFASAVDLADRDGYQRGFAHGQRAAKAEAEAAAVTEHRRVREDAIEAFRSLWIIFELENHGARPPTWEEAQRWARSRMTPL